LADYQWNNTLPSPWWLVSSDGCFAWNDATQELGIFGSSTIIADPSAYSDDPTINVIGPNAHLEVAPTSGSPPFTIHIEGLSLQNSATAQLTPCALPYKDQMIFCLNGLSIDSNSALDLTNNEMILSYATGSDPIAAIQGYLASGYNSGAWNGKGIMSSTARAEIYNHWYSLGYADGADGVVNGLLSGEIEVRFTLAGDANLDGGVNGADDNILSANYNQSISGWDQGDFNYDGLVNAADFNILAANYNQWIY